MKRPRICHMDLAGLANEKSSTMTSFQRNLPMKAKMIIARTKAKRAAMNSA